MAKSRNKTEVRSVSFDPQFIVYCQKNSINTSKFVNTLLTAYFQKKKK